MRTSHLKKGVEPIPEKLRESNTLKTVENVQYLYIVN